MSAARHLWRCSAAGCEASARNLGGDAKLRLPPGWRVAGSEVLCSACAAEHYRRLGSPLHSGEGLPPLRVPSRRALAAMVRGRGRTRASKPGEREARWAALRAAVEVELRADPQRGNAVIAEAVGCVAKTVRTVRRRLEADGVIEVVEAPTSRDGRRRPARWTKARVA